MNKKYRLKTDEELLASGWEPVDELGDFHPKNSGAYSYFRRKMRETQLSKKQINKIVSLGIGEFIFFQDWAWSPEMFIEVEEKSEEKKSEKVLPFSRIKAYELLSDYRERPIFNVKIGICSPQVTDTTLEDALAELDRCSKFTTEYLEYVYIYVSDFVEVHLRDELEEALNIFNLGSRRACLNQDGFYT